ncbi:IPTL-CTERM sorting domain-containing protein [Comamonas odontotermitis]|uniref:IPTL-CTERM sorting domain-containing protein n=1 Tax=Comamonas odontotermitis TaxID=379895 RepID=UPI001CC5C879|nr:IPTL-CTERM sorting domain-containing protein [Comamonas odontotermitis]UBB17756.1 IPTL-CTERM sorting domain-containing protein [Comamonas odontotermitis]
MRKYNNFAIGAIFFATFHAHSAEITVAANSNYFANWSFSDFQPPAQTQYYYDGAGNRGTYALPAGGGQNVGTLAGNPLTWTVPEQDAAKITAGVFTTNRNVFGTNLPPGLFGAAPTPNPGQGFLNRGIGQFSTTKPFAPGTTFFFQDFDNTETAEYHFYDCAGSQVDAGDFDFLKISTINTPSHSVQGSAPNRYWTASAVVANDPNTVSGISIKANNVCRIDISGTRPAGTGGSVNYFLGSPPNVVPTAVPAIAGTMQVGSVVTGSYAYADNESDAENPAGTTYKFVSSPNASIASSSEGTTVASGTTGGASASVPYTLSGADLNMYIYYCVTPAAQTGASPGVEVCTAASGPVVDKPTPPIPPTPAAPANVPTLGEWGVIGLSSLIAMFGFLRMRRRQD